MKKKQRARPAEMIPLDAIPERGRSRPRATSPLQHRAIAREQLAFALIATVNRILGDKNGTAN